MAIYTNVNSINLILWPYIISIKRGGFHPFVPQIQRRFETALPSTQQLKNVISGTNVSAGSWFMVIGSWFSTMNC